MAARRLARVVHNPMRRNPWIIRRMSVIGEYEYWLGRRCGMGFLADPDNGRANIIGFKTRAAAQKQADFVNEFDRELRLMPY